MTRFSVEAEEFPSLRRRPAKGYKKPNGADRFQVCVPSEMANYIRIEAYRRGISASAVIRDLIRAGMELGDD